MAFTDEMIRAAVRTGQYSDPAAEKHIADTLIARRDAIGRAWLTNVNPVVDPALDASGTLQLQQRGRRGRRRQGAGLVRSGLVHVRQRHRHGDADRRSRSTRRRRAGDRAAGLPAGAGAFVRVDIKAVDRAASVVGDPGARLLPAYRRRAGSWSGSSGCPTERAAEQRGHE